MCFILLSLLEELPECVAAADTANICIVTFDRKVCLHNRFTGTQLKITACLAFYRKEEMCFEEDEIQKRHETWFLTDQMGQRIYLC